MALDPSAFEVLQPSSFLSFTIPSPCPSLSAALLRVAVLDSPLQLPSSHSAPVVAAILVPKHRENDWLFSTESGQLQLLLSSPGVQRLILIGDEPSNSTDSSTFYRRPSPAETDSQKKLLPILQHLVIALSPKSCFQDQSFEVPFLCYEDNVVSSIVLEKCVGSFVGEMLVEDVEIERDFEGRREFRRRLRFKRMPNLIQTEIRIVPKTNFGSDAMEIGGEVKFCPDVGVLVHVYLVPMVASLALIASCIEERTRLGFKPKALCVGVGGGALVGFLRSPLGFKVVGVERDEEVLRIARTYFGLEDEECVRIHVGDAMEFMEELAYPAGGHKAMNKGSIDACKVVDPKFDVVMVDLDSEDPRGGINAPSLEFIRKSVLLAARSILCEYGILVVNVIPSTKSFYDTLINQFREIFNELYEIDVRNGENFVLIAKVLPTASSVSDSENGFLQKLRVVISRAYMESLRKI